MLAPLCKLEGMALRNFERPTPSFLVAAGYGLLGSAFLVEAVRLGIQIRDAKKNGGGVGGVGSRRRRGQLGWAANENDETVEEARSRTRGAVTSAKIREVATIEERLEAIKGLTIKSSLDPRIREDSLAIVSRKCGPNGNRSWCVPEKDWWGEVKAIFTSFRDPNSLSAVRYVRDHPEVDQFTLAGKTLFRLRAGDCDDQAIALAARLRSIGYPVAFRVIRSKGAPTWSHIYVMVGLPPTGPTKWVPLDTTVPGAPPGWEAPANMIVAKRDFPL